MTTGQSRWKMSLNSFRPAVPNQWCLRVQEVWQRFPGVREAGY